MQRRAALRHRPTIAHQPHHCILFIFSKINYINNVKWLHKYSSTESTADVCVWEGPRERETERERARFSSTHTFMSTYFVVKAFNGSDVCTVNYEINRPKTQGTQFDEVSESTYWISSTHITQIYSFEVNLYVCEYLNVVCDRIWCVDFGYVTLAYGYIVVIPYMRRTYSYGLYLLFLFSFFFFSISVFVDNSWVQTEKLVHDCK